MSESEAERVLFDGLRAELEDPVLQQAIEEARYWDEKVRLSDKDNETLRTTIRASLDKAWSEWKGHPVTITGYAHRVLGEHDDIRPDPVLLTPDSEITSRGFKIVYTDVDGENIHGNPYGYQYRVVHDLRLKLSETTHESLYAFIDSHDIQSDHMSEEYAERWLGSTQQEYMSRLRDLTDKAKRPETKLVTIGTSCEPGLHLDVFNKKNRAALEAYINRSVGVDTSVPYIFTTRQNKILYEDKGKGGKYDIITTPLKAIGKFSNIYFQKINPAPVNNGAGDWWLSVRATVHDEQVEGAERTMIIPLRSLKNIRSLRVIGYEALRNIDRL